MRTMAYVLFGVIVHLSMNAVLGIDNGMNCNACIRTGGNWCNDRVDDRCVSKMEQGWCPNGREVLKTRQFGKPGQLVNPVYVEKTVFFNTSNFLDIHYPGPNITKPQIRLKSSTQNLNIRVEVLENRCSTDDCTLTINAVPGIDFCKLDPKPAETVIVSVGMGNYEEVSIKYIVACACPCTLNVTKAADVCNHHGDYSCGQCTCHFGWKGEFCDQFNKEDCRGTSSRGDQNGQCIHSIRNEVNCSGNGYCSPCETCICYEDRIGSQYFNQDFFCEDICLQIERKSCDNCFLNTTGFCTECDLSFLPYEESISQERDDKNRTVWVPCRVSVLDCEMEYVVKSENDELFVMIVDSCGGVAGAIVADTKVPMILGVLAGILLVAAAGGFLLWKHMTALPPAALNESQYTNIDAEDCTGENPLYKPPTSSFKNPTYGKW